MVKRDVVLVIAALTAIATLLGACSAAKPVAEAVLGDEFPCGPAAEADGSFEPVAVPDDSVPSEAEIDELLNGPASTVFEPSQTVVVLDDRGLPLVLGPAWPIEVERATPLELAPGSCQFEISLSGQGLDTFNMVASLCFERAAQCSTGRLAVVVDGQLVWAPQMQSPSFDQTTFVISSPTPRTAQENLELAQAMVGSAAQFRLVISDLTSV